MVDLKLPEEYVPFGKVWVCGNNFTDGLALIEIEGLPLFLIGKPEENPKVWLNLPKQVQGKPEWIPIIQANNILDKHFELFSSEYGRDILFKDESILQYQIKDSTLIITHMNFRPVGLNIKGNLKSLSLSGMNLAGNQFVNVGVMVKIGG